MSAATSSLQSLPASTTLASIKKIHRLEFSAPIQFRKVRRDSTFKRFDQEVITGNGDRESYVSEMGESEREGEWLGERGGRVDGFEMRI